MMKSTTHKKINRVVTSIVLVGVLLIVTHTVAPGAKAHDRTFSKGRTQRDLVSHVYKFIHSSAERQVGQPDRKKSHADASHHTRKHKGKSCVAQSHDFVCPSRGDSNSDVVAHIDISLSGNYFDIPLPRPFSNLPVHLVDIPPPRLPQDEKISLLL